ncbi:hypothetical protein [Rhizobium leguminosarum]|uniref:hypothetical protein n=1 Tax=Rhizobium leguminosarum TaxID=384 RepID=UPI0010133D87|nr:hypothetical protein [Rhizobium leguminosarum]
MSVLYHISKKDEYRLVHCSNASDANLRADLVSPLPLLLAKIKGSIPAARGPCGLQTAQVFSPLPISLSAEAMHLTNA